MGSVDKHNMKMSVCRSWPTGQAELASKSHQFEFAQVSIFVKSMRFRLEGNLQLVIYIKKNNMKMSSKIGVNSPKLNPTQSVMFWMHELLLSCNNFTLGL